jgi:single-stranded-DNA-specific exonuclease
MAHPDQGLELLLADDLNAASGLAEALWQLNLNRRDVERAIVAEAVAIVEASPDDERARDALVVVGDGWHEGVVGIVASRLVERFGRPTIVLTRDGERAKGSGRSLPGVDLHALVRAASERLVRWGGHPGAVGLELRSEDVHDFRERLAEAAAGVRGSIEKARIRVVDAVISPRELTLPAAEEIQRLAPFGRGNPEVRLAVPACQIVHTARVGQDKRHMEVRLRAAGVTARAIGFGMGERQPGIDDSVPHDAIVRLEVDRYQEIVGPRSTIEALDPVGPLDEALGMCRQACDANCADRATLTLELVDAHDAAAAPPEHLPATPRSTRDRRGETSAVALLASLAHADGGAVAVVSDVARRRSVFSGALEPRRLGLEAAVLAGRRCDPVPAADRLAGLRGAPVLAMVEYAQLPFVELPPNAHVVLVDPPSCDAEARWAVARADGRHLHLVWGEDEVAFARTVLDEGADVRAVAADVWRALRDGVPRPWGSGLDRLLLGEGPVMRPAATVARALAVLREIGMVTANSEGLRANADAPPRDIATSEGFQRIAALTEDSRGFLDKAMVLHLDAPALAPALVAAL